MSEAVKRIAKCSRSSSVFVSVCSQYDVSLLYVASEWLSLCQQKRESNQTLGQVNVRETRSKAHFTLFYPREKHQCKILYIAQDFTLEFIVLTKENETTFAELITHERGFLYAQVSTPLRFHETEGRHIYSMLFLRRCCCWYEYYFISRILETPASGVATHLNLRHKRKASMLLAMNGTERGSSCKITLSLLLLFYS